jgi:plastocyanin
MKGVIACAGIAAVIAFTGCGDDDSPSTTSSASASASESTDQIDIADFKYMPDAVTVSAGAEVTWTNSDDAPHTASASDDSFDTGDLDRGDSKTIAFDEPGTYAYFCRFHPFMKATVEVQ